MIETSIVEGELPAWKNDDTHEGHGAELVFYGRVRDEELGKKILALEYEHYQGMAEKELQQLAEDTVAKFPIGDFVCHHRVGKIAVGQASIRVSIWSKHRVESLEAMAWFISELKVRVPIWKWALTVDGERLPSKCTH